MLSKKTIALVPSAYNPSAMGDIENFIKYYKEDFDVYVIVDKEIKDDIEVKDGVCYVMKSSRSHLYIQTTADYIIDAGALASGNKFCSSQKRISVWHGIPYKKMFVDLAKRHMITAIDYAADYDLMVSPSKWYTERFLRESMLYEGEVLETAISRTDSLFIDAQKKKSIKKQLKIPKKKKILLYAPTFRQEGPFSMPFSAERIINILGEDWVILVKAHYLNTLTNCEGIVDATSYPSINNLMAIADLMITDYSSVLFDYSILGKPALLYQYDREEYEADRSFMFEMEEYVDERDILFSEDELCNRLREYNKLGDNLQKIRKNFYPHQKENATEELVKKLKLDSSGRKISEVIFLVNNLNEVGGVHAFILNLAKQIKNSCNSKVYVLAINEYNGDKGIAYTFDPDGIIDIKLSFETYPGTIKSILRRTDGCVVSCQYSAHLKFGEYLEDKKSVLMFHGDTKDIVERTLYSWHLDSLNEGTLENYDRLAFLTPSNCDVIKKELNEKIKDKVIAIENGMDFSDAKCLYKESGDFVFVSRLDDDKNPMEVIKIFSSSNINPEYRLHIYGDGTLMDDMEKKVAELGKEDTIIFHGFESDKEIIFKDKQGLISVSLTEGLPLTFLEASKYGIPIYAYDSFTSCRDIVKDNTGRIIETGDIEGFVESINNPMDYESFSNEAIVNTYSNEAITERWIQLFDDLDKEHVKSETVIRGLERSKRKKKESLVKSLKKSIREGALFKDNIKYAELSTKWRNIKDKDRKKEMPLVSIIMPFYNNNATILNAVRSVEKSGYKNYEILLINDGSKEDPQSILGNREKLSYYYKDNGGLSDTRNYGIERAKGKYLFFLDSDDITYPDGLYRLVSYAEENDLKLVCGKTVRHRVIDGVENIWYEGVYRRTYINEMKNRHLLIDDTIATGKLYRRDMINDIGIRFKKGLYEDILFTGELYGKLDRIGIVKKIVQKWMVYGSNTSITTRLPISNSLTRLENIDKVFEMQESELNRIYYTRQYIRHQIIASVNGFNDYNEEERRLLYDVLRKGALLRKDYAVYKLQSSAAKIDFFQALLDDDYELFCRMAEAYSDKYEEDIKSQK